THLGLLQKAVDMRFPSLQNDTARLLTRKIHLHVGPTNSGKTHGALQALCKAKTGLYAGPLRLLAHEVWYRINEGLVSPNIPPRECNLVTGEETKTMSSTAGLLACTVEMVKPDTIVDVAVIDEIQMIADEQRGFAWTSAVLRIAAKEMHLCGEASVIPLIKKIADDCGDEVIVHEYERLTPLRVGEPLGDLSKITKGDCIVAFSRTGIFNVKNEIEKLTGLKCAVAYGALPPETKAEQAKLFNDPNNDVDVMVASDAIGMGLNLKIKRVIFTEVSKWNGKQRAPISFSQIKQIAGRAGRYGTTEKGVVNEGGIATTLKPEDLETLKIALQAPLKPITHASITPELEHISSLATLIPVKYSEKSGTLVGRPYGKLLTDASLLFRIDHSKFVAGSFGQQNETMPIIEASIPHHAPLTLAERSAFSNAPINIRDEELVALFGNMIRLYAYGNLNSFEDVAKGSGLLDTLRDVEAIRRAHKPEEFVDEAVEAVNDKDDKPVRSGSEAESTLDINTLIALETLHRGLTVYRWLSMRFPIAFPFYTDAAELKTRTERAIDYCLESIRANRQRRLAALGR
ncbi:P-loop containing nucleoside triphosphate hydrolase protein, partial [Meira miltonrushii]